ncbi:MAG: hypothetical protein E6R14_10525 [Thermomicrobiales bacterium]|nr:MAG: hypothetical protein E6R14_10525 [Thermomicrobiales bacterium]
MSGKVSEGAATIGADARISRRHAMALGVGALAASVLPISLTSAAANEGQISPEMDAALGKFLDANCRYHQAYRALPAGRMAITPPALSAQWMSANVELRRAVEAVMNVGSTSAEDVRTKMQVVGVFFMKESPPESYWAAAEAIRWNSVIDWEALRFGLASA